jgi:hypothetical protein
MKRLYITAEGETEEAFAMSVICEHLVNYDVNVLCRRILTKKDKLKSYRGGITNYSKAKNDIKRWMLEDQSNEAVFTTMFDYYALPSNFPGFEEVKNLNNVYDKVLFLEEKMKDDIGDRRFIPYIQLHEFESLIFSKIEYLEYEYLDRTEEIQKLKKQLEEFNRNPELINDGRETAPSKRIEKLIPEYKKVFAGNNVAKLIGIEHMKNNCTHFRAWIEKLERITATN